MITSRFQRPIASACLTLVLAASAAAQPKRVELNDLGLELTLSGPRLAPDGRQVAMVVSRTNYPDNRYERSLVLVDVATGAWRDLTPARRNVRNVEWSPSGDRLAFIDQEADDKKGQLYVLPIGGGEARRITDAKRGIVGFAWRPDGQAFALLTEDDPVELTGEEKHNKSFEVGDNTYLDQTPTLPTHLWTISAEGGEATRVTSGVQSVKSIEWTPDGKRWLMSVWPRPHSGEFLNGTVVIRDVDGGAERTLSDRRPVSTRVTAPAASVSPDGRMVAQVASRGPELGFHPGTVIVTPIDGGPSRDLTADLDRDVGGVRWLPDSRGVVVTGPDLTRQRVWVQPLGGAARRLEWGSVNAREVHINAAGALVFIGQEANWPGELYHVASLDATPRRLTDLNLELGGREVGRVETISWQGPDGFSQNGVVVYPPDFVTGRQYPLVLNIHGGPMSTSTESWSTPNQLLAAQGWIVFSPNYRGSNNMGDQFQSAVINDAGDGPGRDVMSGVAALKERGIVDASRIAATGWSYGGYMTAWLTAKYPDFRAAVAGAAVTDWFDWYNLADLNTWAGFGLGGSPWRNDNAMSYWRQSPMAYAHQIKTPTLILSNTGDPRVPVTQSYKLYHALKDNGTPVRFIAYPTGEHFPPDPVHARDVWRRWVEWISEQFGPTS